MSACPETDYKFVFSDSSVRIPQYIHPVNLDRGIVSGGMSLCRRTEKSDVCEIAFLSLRLISKRVTTLLIYTWPPSGPERTDHMRKQVGRVLVKCNTAGPLQFFPGPATAEQADRANIVFRCCLNIVRRITYGDHFARGWVSKFL